MLVPVAIGLLYWVTLSEPLAIAESVGHGVLIALAGPRHGAAADAVAFGARRVSFTALGLMQYFAPSLQFLIGIGFGEAFTPAAPRASP